MSPKVSIIIPVYKSEKYLSKCLESVCRQTLDDIEIIIINDGSPDNSQTIIDRYAASDSRIISISKINEGQGVARNVGMKKARGEYIAFVDSDDWLEPEMYQKMYEAAKKNDAEITVCNFRDVSSNFHYGKSKNLTAGLFDLNSENRNDFIYDYFWGTAYGLSVWNKLYKRSFLEKNQLEFLKETIAEDFLFNFFCVVHAPRILVIDEILYNYYIRPDSISHSPKPDFMFRYMHMVDTFKRYIHRHEKHKDFDIFIPLLVFTAVSAGMYNIYSVNRSIVDMTKEIKKVKGLPVYKFGIKNLAFGKSTDLYSNFITKFFVRLTSLLLFLNFDSIASVCQYIRFRVFTDKKGEV